MGLCAACGALSLFAARQLSAPLFGPCDAWVALFLLRTSTLVVDKEALATDGLRLRSYLLACQRPLKQRMVV